MASINIAGSSLAASFPGLNRANGTDQLSLVATLVDTAGDPLEGAAVDFMVSPVFREDVVSDTLESPLGTYYATFTTKDASIKQVSLLVDGVEVGLTAQVELVEFDDSFLVDDPFTENVGQLAADLTISGEEITIKAEANNSGAITEITWNGQQLLNARNKDRALQTKVVKDNFGKANWAQLNEAGALRQAWADTSSSRYIGDAQDLRHLVTQTFLSYREPVSFGGQELDCSGDILTKHIGMDYLGNPNIFRINFENDQYASNKLGATSWAVSLGLTQEFTRFYTFAPTETVTEPTEGALSSAVEVVNTTYMGGPIATNGDGTLAIGIFRTMRAEGAELLSSFVRPPIFVSGALKFTENYAQLIDFEDSAASGGMSSGKHRMERFICVGTLQAVTNAFRELQYFLTTGLQNPGDPGEPPPPPTQTVDSIAITAAPTGVTRGAVFNASIRAVDFTGATVTDYNGTVTVTAPSSLGLIGTVTTAFTNGETTFSNLALTGSGVGNLVFTTQTNLGPRTGTHTIGLQNEVPTINTLTPSTAPDSTPALSMRVDGTGFENGQSTVRWGGTDLATVFNSGGAGPDFLTATLPGSLLNQSSVPYSVSVFNQAPGGGPSNSLPFLVTDGTAPEVLNSGVTSQGTTAVITWQTDEPSLSNLFYGPTGSSSTQEILVTDGATGAPLYTTQHQVQLSALASQTPYTATIATEDGSGNRNATAAVVSWATDDIVAPTIEDVTVNVLGPNNTNITVSVDEGATVNLTLRQGFNPVSLPAPIAASPGSPAVFQLSGLSGGTLYTYEIVATDFAGNASDPSSGSFTTQAAADTTPPAFISQPQVNVNGLGAQVNWVMDEICSGRVLYRLAGSQSGYTVAVDASTNTSHVVNILLPSFETVYEFYVEGEDAASNYYLSATEQFATGPDLTGPGGGLDPSPNDLTSGETLTSLRINVPEGVSSGDEFIAHATVPVARPSDLTVNWAVEGTVVQRHVSSYKPRAQPTSSRFTHQLVNEQITFPAQQWQAQANTLPTGWATTPALTWTAAPLADPTTVSPVRFYSDLTAGTYELKIKGDSAYVASEYFYVRINGGTYQQAHGTAGEFGGYTDATETTYITFTVGANEVGEYLLEIAGASDQIAVDRIAIVPTGQTPDVNLNSPVVVTSNDPTGANSVEIVFPVTVPINLGTYPNPQGSAAAQYFDVNLVATDNGLPSGSAQDGREIDQAKLVMDMPKPAVDAGYDAVMDAVIAGGAGTVIKSGPYMDEVMYYTRLTDASGNAGVGVHTYARFYKASVDDAVYLDLSITNSHVDTARIVSGMSENAYVGNPGKIFFDRMYLETNSSYNVINGFGQETVTAPDGGAMTVGDPFCGGPALGDATTFFFVDYTDDPATDLTRSHDGTGGIAARSEVFHAGAQRIEQIVLRPASPVKSDAYSADVSQYQNIATTLLGETNRNATQQLRWYGGNYYRGGDLPETYVAQSPFPSSLTGNLAYDQMRMNNAALAIQEVLSTGAIQPNRDFFEQGGISGWADMTQFGCWTPGGAVDGSSSKNHMLNVYETAGGPGHTRGWAFFARTVLQRHAITAFDASGAPITIRHLYGTSAQAGATANESAIQLRNDQSGQAHGWSFFYEREEWEADRFYSRGTQVRYQGIDYVCLTSHRTAIAPSVGAVWAAGSIDNTRTNQREFNGSYPIVPVANIDSGAAYTPALTVSCAYDTAWDQFAPISRDYIQRLYRCFMGLRLSVNAGIFNDYQSYQTELYLAAEDRFITQDVLNGGKTNDTLGHCLEAFTGGNTNRGFFHNDNFSDPGMQSDWGAGKAWAHWVIAQGMFFTAPEEVYPAPVLGGSEYNRRQHIREHMLATHEVIAAVMPGESAGNITETYPSTPAARRQYLNSRNASDGLQDADAIGAVVAFPAASGQWTIELLKTELAKYEPGTVEMWSRITGDNPEFLLGRVLDVNESSANAATIWLDVSGNDVVTDISQGVVALLLDNQGGRVSPTGGQFGYLLQVGGQELDGRAFSHAKTSDQQINTHMWQCLAESLNGFDTERSQDLFRLSVDHAQFDLQNSGSTNETINWFSGADAGGNGNGTFSEWSGKVFGTSSTFAGGYYPTQASLIPTARTQTSLTFDSSTTPYTGLAADRRTSRDGQDVSRIPAVTGRFSDSPSTDWANLAWIAAYYSTKRLDIPGEASGLLSPYLLNSYLRSGLGYELEPNSPFVTYDGSGNIISSEMSTPQRTLINSFNETEEYFGAKNRVLAGSFAKSPETENWATSAPIMAEVDFELRQATGSAAGIRFLYTADTTGDYETPLQLVFTPGTSTVNQSVTLANNGIPTASNINVTLSLIPDPEGSSPTFPGPTRLQLLTTSFIIPANSGTFTAPIQLEINSNAVDDFYDEAPEGALIQAVATGAISETIQMPVTLTYPQLEDSIVSFPNPGTAIQDGGTVTVNVTRTNPQQLIDIPVGIVAEGTGFTVQGLSNDVLRMNTGVAQASFTVTYNQPVDEDPGAITFTLQENPNEPFDVNPSQSQFVVTALTPIEGGDSDIAVSRIGAGDGAGGPAPAAMGLAAGDLTLVNVMVPVKPSQAVSPQYAMGMPSGNSYLADSFAAGYDADGINLVQVTCPVIADSLGNLRHSIPADNVNPAIRLSRLSVGDTVPDVAPGAINTMNLAGVRVKLLDSDGVTYTFDPSSASQRILLDGNYTRQVEYYGQASSGADNLMVIRMIVTERSDFEAATVDIVIENSAVSCPTIISTTQAEEPNSAADGTVYFTSIELEGGNYDIREGASHPSQGTSGGAFYLVKPYSTMHSGGGSHGILPGQWFVRRVVLAAASVNSTLTTDMVNREDWGFVEGGLGYVQGGFGVSGEGLPMYSTIGGLSFAGETGFRAAKARADQDITAAVADFQTGTLPATTALGGGSTAWTSWGWFKGTGDPSTLKNLAAVKPFGANVPSWRPGLGLLTLVDRTIERSGFAVFNLDTGYPLRDSEYRTGGQTPAAFNLFRNPALDVNPWLWTNTDLPGSSATTNWARAAGSKQTNQSCAYLDTADMVNWHNNATDLFDPTEPSQTDRDPSYGPFRGSANSRTLQAYVPAIYLLNDRVAKVLCEYDATRAMFGFARYDHKGGGQSASRSPYGGGQQTFGLYFLANGTNSPYLNSANNDTNTGIVLKSQSDGAGGFNARIAEMPGVESWASPALAVATAFHVGASNTRSWIAPGSDRNWFSLMQAVLPRIVSTNGVLGASVAYAVEVGIPKYGGTSNVAQRTGPLPGPSAGNGAITNVTKPDELTSETQVFGEVSLTWDYPISGYPVPDSFEVLIDGQATGTTQPGSARSRTLTGLDGGSTYTINVVASYSGTTATSDPLTGVLADGSDGTANQPQYDGETDLPTGYYVPETTFNYLIDVSADTNTSVNAIKTAQLEFANRIASPPGSSSYIGLNGRTSAEPTRIAVLLPPRTETAEVSVSRTVNGPTEAEFGLTSSNVEIHFVAPWASSFSVSNRENAANEARQDAVTYEYIYDVASASSADLTLDGTYENAHVSYHLWNWDIRLTKPIKLGRTAASSALTARVHKEQDVYFHLCKITDKGTALANGIDAELVRLQLEGVYIDLPNATGSAVTMDAVPYGNMSWRYVDVLGSGGAAIQVRNSDAIDTNHNGDLRGRIQSGSPGTILLTQWYCTQFSGDSPYAMFSLEGDHHAIEFGDNTNFIVTGTNTTPILRVYNDNTADTTLGATSGTGGFCSGVLLTGVNMGFYSEDPTAGVIQIDAAANITITGRISVGNSATIDTVRICTEGRGLLASTADLFNLLAINPADPGQVSNWLTASGVTGTNDISGEGGSNLVDLGPLSAVEPAYQAFTGPTWDEVSSDPYVSGTAFSAVSMYQAGLSRIAAKTVITTPMIAARAPRGVSDGGFDIKNWRVDGSEPNGVYTEISGDPNFIDVSSDGTVITFADFYNDGSNMNAGQQKVMYAQYSDRSQSDNIGGEVVLSREYYERPVGAQVVFNNIRVNDISSRYYAPGEATPPNRALKWGGRMNAMPNLHVKDCDFGTIHEEHGLYGNSEGPILIENSTFTKCTAQGTQWVHRFTENPYAENHEFSENEPPTREVRNTHFIDCGSYSPYAGRKSSNLTFQDSGYPELPCPYVRVTDCTFVNGIEVFEAVANEGNGAPNGDYRYRYTNNGIYQTSGNIQIGVEGGFFRNPHLYNNVDMQPIAQARDDDSAAVHKVIELKNVYVHTMDPDKPVVRFMSSRNIIIEDTVIILEWREGGTAKPCLVIDGDAWKAEAERNTVNPHYLFSQKLILRNSVIEVHDYRGGGAPVVTDGSIQFSNGFYLSSGYNQRLNSAQLDDYANTLGREVEFGGYYADGQIRDTAQVEAPIYDGAIRTGHTSS